jgi:RND family efflux transporter MFP subunit
MPGSEGPARPRHLLTRYLLPGAILLGFVGVLGWTARDSLLPGQPVTVVPVLTTRAEVRQEGTPLFQAAGWVEPRPTPVLVTALTEGVVERLLVVEGQQVQAGEPVARLIDADARLALQSAEADLRLRQAELQSARAALRAATTNAEQPVHLEAAAAEAEAMLAQKETELGTLPFQLKTADARRELAQANVDRLRPIREKGAVSEASFLTATNELKVATTAVEELRAREPRLRREVAALVAKSEALRKRLALKTEETRQLGEARAAVDAADARVRLAETAVESARLRLERTVVRAPSAGRVLALIARPGMRLMGLAAQGLQEASTVISLYDPAMLQVRADVRLEDVPRAQPGQPVRIEGASAPGPLDGEVLFATSQADIQKNTLQVKVAIKSPPPVLKPDMLVQVTFLTPPSSQATPTEAEQLRMLVPCALVESDGGGSVVWVADQAAGMARRRPVTLGVAAGDFVEVVKGLTPADRLIAGGKEGLRNGERITVTGEERGAVTTSVTQRPKASRLPPAPAAGDTHGKH